MSEKSDDETEVPQEEEEVLPTQSVDVDVEPALHELVDLQDKGLITPFKAAKLRSHFGQAFDRLEQERKIGKQLLQSAKVWIISCTNPKYKIIGFKR